MFDITYKAVEILESNETLEKFGKLLNQTWSLKKQLSKGVSSNNIDMMYSDAIKAGAIGGKLLGAGGGGFMLFFVPIKKQRHVRKVLSNFYEVNFSLSKHGSTIIQ